MKLELYIQNNETGTIYDVSNIAGEINTQTYIDDEPGKLTCTLQKDPNNLLKLTNGSRIWFKVDNKGIFFGYIFKIGTDSNENYQLTCYDQLRYLKNSDIYKTSNMTASAIFDKVCSDYELQHEIKVPTNFVPEPHIFSGKSLYNIIKRGMDLASINDKCRYFIRDDYGTIVWSELQQEKTNIQIGEGSMLTNYQYEKSIDDDTYNQIKIYQENKTTGERKSWIVKDSSTIAKWGLLQYIEKVDDDTNEALIRETAENYLKIKNRQTETLKIEALGIDELVAGKGIKFVLNRESISKWMWIISSSHRYTKYEHTMELEVEI